MPNQRRDNDSGALIFDLTADEKAVKQSHEDINELKEMVKSLTKEVETLRKDAEESKASNRSTRKRNK